MEDVHSKSKSRYFVTIKGLPDGRRKRTRTRDRGQRAKQHIPDVSGSLPE
ncbi:MAG: hypothetical protein H6Q65_204 [Firmicutes bacterium]|nr:hypothetical protein [Bacillota bacterium]